MAASREDLNALNQILGEVNKQIIAIGKNSAKAFDEIGEPKTIKNIKDTEKAIDELNQSTKELEKNKKDQINNKMFTVSYHIFINFDTR